MNKKRRLLSIAVILLGLLSLFLFFNRQAPLDEGDRLTPSTLKKSATQIIKSYQGKKKPKGQQKKQEELKPKELIVDLFFKSLDQEISPQNFIKKIQDLKLTPIVQKEGDKDFGEAYIIRTQNSLPGTRYLHAQYDPDPSGRPSLSHLSIEFPPGAEAMSKAIDVVLSFGGSKLGLITTSDDFMRWSLPNGRHIWLKEMDLEYMKSIELFNGYTKDDVGTIRLVIENDRHPQGHDHPLDD